jgi:hypothetical protein
MPTTRDTPTLLVDQPETGAAPVVMTDAYVELNGVNVKCLTNSVQLTAENSPIEVTSFCGVQEYPGPVKYHLILKLYQSFDQGGTDEVLQAALAAGVPMPFKIRPMQGRSDAAPDNPEFSGFVIPQPYDVFGGDAGTASEVDIDWILTAPASRNTGTPIVAAGATAGAPGIYTPAGAVRPANLAALTAGVTASPTTAWNAGQYVVTADMLGAFWNGTAWTLGIAS